MGLIQLLISMTDALKVSTQNSNNNFLLYNGGWVPATLSYTYSSADSPTFIMNAAGDATALLYPGMRIKLTQSSTVKYFIVTAVGSYSGGVTPITLYGGTDYVIANSAISNVSYSNAKAPAGFSIDPNKWSIKIFSTSTVTISNPSAVVWVNVGSLSITIPIGAWNVSYNVVMGEQKASSTYVASSVTLSTSNNSESDIDFTTFTAFGTAIGTINFANLLTKTKQLNLAAKTTYYLNAKPDDSLVNFISFMGARSKTTITAICAYL